MATDTENNAADTGANDGAAVEQQNAGGEAGQEQGHQAAADSGSDTQAGGQGGDDSLSYDLKSPEGVEMAEDDLKGIADTAKEMGLSNDQAQALVNLKAQWQSEASDQAQANLGNLVKSWEEEIRSDKDFGGQKFDESIQDVKRVMDKFGTDELRSALDETGFGSHPLLFRFVAQIGKVLREDAHIAGDPSSAPRTMADVIYGKQEGA